MLRDTNCEEEEEFLEALCVSNKPADIYTGQYELLCIKHAGLRKPGLDISCVR